MQTLPAANVNDVQRNVTICCKVYALRHLGQAAIKVSRMKMIADCKIFTSWRPFLTPKQHRQSTEDKMTTIDSQW